jgi:hypothetical protein
MVRLGLKQSLTGGGDLSLAGKAERTIAHLEAGQLASGSLAALFREGAIAVVIKGDSRVQRAWESLLPRMAGSGDSSNELLPWEAPFVDLGRNHYAEGGLNCIGDVVHFSPGRISYIGRKLEVSEEKANGTLSCEPPFFSQGGAMFRPDAGVIDLCWQIVADLFSAIAGPGRAVPAHKVVIQRLKYEHAYGDIEGLYRLVESASGRWSQLGYRLDRYREMARGPFTLPGIADVYALLCLSPWIRSGLEKLNARFEKGDRKHAVAAGQRIIGKPHYDGRYFSALTGERDNIRTEVFDGRRWHDVALRPDELLVLPGLAARKLGLKPTMHRVLHVEGSGAGHGRNITLLLGAK